VENKMARTQYDLTIIGGGSGGLTAARIAASLGASVLLIDKERLGGDCLNYGCVPSKSLIHVARVLQQARDAATLGLLPAQLGVDMAKVAEYIQGVTVEFGHVSFNSATELTLNGECFTSRKTLVATGSHPLVPQIEGLEETGYVTNEHVFDLTRRPSSLLVVGGGPIGVELGQAFARLGSRVTIIEGLGRIVPKEDPEVSATLADVLQSEGITIATNATFVKASRAGHKKVAIAKQGAQFLTFEADEILVALGRRPNVEGLNLEAAGVTYTDKGIAVDAYLGHSAGGL
jgi:pyruvate/2-oxoglutarate dehydrogenase complex dihydrolipoamide dehydrogenase (E3) component